MTFVNRLLALAIPIAISANAAEGGFHEDDPNIVQSPAFLRGHPDLLWRNRGIVEYQRRRYADAARHFRDAARYADKPAQAMLAMMLWNGDGIDIDRVQAYAWIDVAAERGYKSFVATRDKFWAALDEDERRSALELGRQLRAEYGDERAKPRLNLDMTRTKNKITGSHLGFAGGLSVLVPGPDGRLHGIPGVLFYQPQYWKPQDYWSWQDRVWELPQEHVEVGPVQPAGDTPERPD